MFENGEPKRLQYLSFGAYAEDFDALARQVRAAGAADPHPLSDGQGVWTRDPDGTPIQLVVGPKVTPTDKVPLPPLAPPAPGKGAAPNRSAAPPVQPRRLAHVLLFSPDVPRQVAFYERTLGLRLSDRSGDIIAFVHGPHASDHHLVAFAKSNAPGYHHSSWDVGRFDDVGLGAESMKAQGYTHGWGVGRHVLGSNYFYYVQDPVGKLGGVLLRHRFRAGRRRLAGRRPSARGLVLHLGAHRPRRFHRQPRGAAAGLTGSDTTIGAFGRLRRIRAPTHSAPTNR